MRYQGKHCRRSVSGKILIVLLAMVLVIGCAVGGTVAWLTQETDSIVNTFTYGNINITLTETTPEKEPVKIIPGIDIEKDPKVTVEANSEACWLFVKVEEVNWPIFTETDNTTKKVSYAVIDDENGWKKLENVEGVDNVYYREVDAVTADTDFYVLKGNDTYKNGVVTVSENLTKTEVNSIADETKPTLTFTAYAVQREGIDTAADAWAKVDVDGTKS